MAITESDSGAELKPSAPAQRREERSFALGAPLGQSEGEYVKNYRTEACSLELLFSGYISSLIPAAESFSPEEQITSAAIDSVVYLLRVLREAILIQLSASMRLPADADPFFPVARIPQLIAVPEKEIVLETTMPLSAYMHRLVSMYPGFEHDPMLSNVSEHLFRVGVKPGKIFTHYLILPDEKELLRTATDGNLFASSFY